VGEYKERLGWLATGRMAAVIAQRLLYADADLTIWNLSPAQRTQPDFARP
jgi:3-hydroxyisobutyrate dehydrogenase-like beta-hydroxyacid dehydrogenase